MQVKQRLAFLKTLVLGQDAASSLRSRAVHSGAWIGVGFGIQKVLQLGSNLILTRLLFPEAFGLMALATVFLVGLAMFSDIGLKPAVIRDPRGDDPEFLNTAWTIQVVRGLLLCVIGAAIAYPLSLIYQQPILFPLLAFLSTTAAINGFMSIGMATAERRLDFRIITIVQLSGQVVSIGLLITLTYFWRSVWALAFANVVSTVMTVAIGHATLSGHQHRLTLHRDSAKSLIKFGRWIFFATLATYLGGEGLKAVQGGLLTATEFGVLAIAYTIAGFPNDLAVKLAGSVGLPVLAETYRKTPERAFSILHALRMRTLAFSISLSSIVILSGEYIIELLYDERYHAAGKYVIALALANAVGSIHQGYTSAILATGRAQTYSIIIASIALLRISGVTVGFSIGSVTGMLYGIAIANAIIILVLWPILKKMTLSDIRLDICMILSLLSVFFLHNLKILFN